MRGTTSFRFVALALAVVSWLLVGLADDKECRLDPELQRIVCTITGTDPGDEPPATGKRTKQPAPPKIRYLYSTGDCYYWSSAPGGIDAWDPANEGLIYSIVLGTPECQPTITDPDADRAWRIFRSFPLATPQLAFQPENHGITGLPTYLAAANPAPITHFEILEDLRPFEVRASVASITVNWGDGTTTTNDPAAALPYPAGAVTHTYTTKTCPPDYRITHPSGPNCHPTLEAYPVSATFTWWGEYRTGGGWIPIGTLDLTSTVLYDVDEVVGVLIDP